MSAETESTSVTIQLRADDPSSEDKFGRLPFSRHLAELIRLHDGKSPAVIGIVGEWGSGKTTVLQFAEKHLGNSREVIWFNPWAYASAGRGAIQEALLAQVAEKVLKGRRKGLAGAKRAARDYGLAVMPIAKAIPFAGEAAAEIGTTLIAKMPDNRKILVEALEEYERRVVVFVDDVDRLTGPELRELFAALRVVVELPYVQYVLAYDAESVATAIHRDTGLDGDTFLEKVVAVPVPVPRIPFEVLYRKLRDELDAILSNAGMDLGDLRGGLRVRELVDLFRPVLSTPRELYRYLNRIRTMVKLAVDAELRTCDFIVCELLAVFDPKFYTLLGSNKTAALGVVPDRLRFRRPKEEDTGHDHAIQVFGAHVKNDRHGSWLLQALNISLPWLHAALTTETYFGGQPETRSLANGEYFDRYFAYSAWADDVPDAEVARRWQLFLSGKPFDSAASGLIDNNARFVLFSKLVKAIDHNPADDASIRRLIEDVERIASTDAWRRSAVEADLFERPISLKLDNVVAHCIAIRYAHDDPKVLEFVEATTLPDITHELMIALSVAFNLRTKDDANLTRRTVAPHIKALLGRPEALERFRTYPERIRDPARVVLFYSPPFDPTPWTAAVKNDPTLLDVVLAVAHGVSSGKLDDEQDDLGDYLAQFIDPAVAIAAGRSLERPSREVARFLPQLEAAAARLAAAGPATEGGARPDAPTADS